MIVASAWGPNLIMQTRIRTGERVCTTTNTTPERPRNLNVSVVVCLGLQVQVQLRWSEAYVFYQTLQGPWQLTEAVP